MKSTGAVHVGNINLRGKKSLVLRCRCCTAYDLRDKVLKTEHQREMKITPNEDDK